MSFLKKYFPYLLLILFVYTWYFVSHLPSHPAATQILGANTSLVLYEEPDSGQKPLLSLINMAQKEILVEVYLLSDPQIIASLDNAENKGISVKIMLEQHPFGGGGLNQKTKSELDTNHIENKWSNPVFSLTHEKAIIIDGQIVCILSQNLTASAFTKNREHDICDSNPTDVIEARNIFIDDWERRTYSPSPHTNLLVSPLTSRAGLVGLLTNATKTVDMQIENMDDPQIEDLLSEKAHSLRIRLLAPTLSQLASNKNDLQKLTSAGVQVRTISSPYMHAKMILIDTSKAYTGSINFSTQSIDHNRELGIILTQPDIIQVLKEDFEKDWEKAKVF